MSWYWNEKRNIDELMIFRIIIYFLIRRTIDNLMLSSPINYNIINVAMNRKWINATENCN